ncbi:hypothetical protein TELCIR_10706, partial [Teladorsagia circumcincta]
MVALQLLPQALNYSAIVGPRKRHGTTFIAGLTTASQERRDSSDQFSDLSCNDSEGDSVRSSSSSHLQSSPKQSSGWPLDDSSLISSNGLPIPRLPTAPSRVDRLIVDFFREHARITTLLSKMEQLRSAPLPSPVHQALKELLEAVTILQHCRHHERTAILQQLRGETVRYDEEK